MAGKQSWTILKNMLKLIDGRGKIDACTGFTSGGLTPNDRCTLCKLVAVVQLKTFVTLDSFVLQARMNAKPEPLCGVLGKPVSSE